MLVVENIKFRCLSSLQVLCAANPPYWQFLCIGVQGPILQMIYELFIQIS